MLHSYTLTLNRNPGGMSALSDEAPPSTVPLTVAGKVSTTTAGRELWQAVAAKKEEKKPLRKENPKLKLQVHPGGSRPQPSHGFSGFSQHTSQQQTPQGTAEAAVRRQGW